MKIVYGIGWEFFVDLLKYLTSFTWMSVGNMSLELRVTCKIKDIFFWGGGRYRLRRGGCSVQQHTHAFPGVLSQDQWHMPKEFAMWEPEGWVTVPTCPGRERTRTDRAKAGHCWAYYRTIGQVPEPDPDPFPAGCTSWKSYVAVSFLFYPLATSGHPFKSMPYLVARTVFLTQLQCHT